MSKYYSGSQVNAVLGKCRKKNGFVKRFVKFLLNIVVLTSALLIGLWGWILLVFALRLIGLL